VGFLKHGRRRCDGGGAADDNAVTKACGVLSLRDMTFYITLVIAPPPPGAVDELEPPHQIPVRARPKLDAFCALRPSRVCKCKGIWTHESCHWAVLIRLELRQVLHHFRARGPRGRHVQWCVSKSIFAARNPLRLDRTQGVDAKCSNVPCSSA
jgi:hypothetical protein